MEANKFSVKAADGILLACRSWLPAGPPEAVVLLVHGLGEHSGRYHEMGEFLATKQIGLLAYDLRGHGNSPGTRGHSPYDKLLSDVNVLLHYINREFPEAAVFLYGHSMGGNVAVNYVSGNPVAEKQLRGLILSSPWLRLKMEPPVYAVALSKAVRLIYPAFTQENRIDPSWLSRDPKVGAAYLVDPLVHSRISAGTFYGMYQHGREALQHPDKIKVPLLIMHGEDDHVTSIEASRDLAEKVTQASMKAWPGLRHETHHEPEKEEVMNFVASWIEEKLQG